MRRGYVRLKIKMNDHFLPAAGRRAIVEASAAVSEIKPTGKRIAALDALLDDIVLRFSDSFCEERIRVAAQPSVPVDI